MTDIHNLGELIDRAFEVREEKRRVEAEAKDLGAELRELEFEILEKIDEVGVTTARASLASVTITEQTVPQVEDFDAVLDWIGEDFGERRHILQRRVSSAVYKEMLDMGDRVPGVEPYRKRGVSLRKLSS